MNSNIVPPESDIARARAAYIDAFQPFEPGSARHEVLIAHVEKLEAEQGGWSELLEQLKTNRHAGALGYLHGEVFGIRPPFPDIEGPTWATEHLDGMTTPASDLERMWTGGIVEREHFTAELERFDYYDFDAAAVTQGETTLQVVIGRNEAIQFVEPMHAREAARQLLAAADTWEGLVADERTGNG